MTGLEFLDEVPFADVYIHSVIQAPDGRRMSKSLGTGIDPLELIDSHGADALRFGLLAMSSSQDVRFSEAKVQQGRDLANKLWNASRLILLNAGEATPAPATERGRGPLDPLAPGAHRRDGRRADRRLRLRPRRARALPLHLLRALRLVPRDRQAAALRGPRSRPRGRRQPAARARAHARARAPADAVRHRGDLELPARPRSRADRLPVPERRRGDASTRPPRPRSTRSIELDPRPAALARAGRGRPGRRRSSAPRRRRPDWSPGWRGSSSPAEGETVATVGAVEILASAELDAGAVAGRLDERRRSLESEVRRAEGKLANEGFVAKAPADVVEAEREKLERYRAELRGAGRRRPGALPRQPRAGRLALRARADARALRGARRAAAARTGRCTSSARTASRR